MDDCNVWIWRDDMKGEIEDENVKNSIVDVVKEIVSGAGNTSYTGILETLKRHQQQLVTVHN